MAVTFAVTASEISKYNIFCTVSEKITPLSALQNDPQVLSC